MEKKYEPWTDELINYIAEAKSKEYVFDFNRQEGWEYHDRKGKEFRELYYTVAEHFDKDGKKIHKHDKRISFNALRKARAVELRQKFGFSIDDISEYIGLRPQIRGFQLPQEPEKMSYINWKLYIKKLCKSNT